MKFTKLLLTISLSLINFIGIFSQTTLTHPATELYKHSWVTTGAHPYKDFEFTNNEYIINILEYSMPANSKIITSNYGYRKSFKRMHRGIDIKVYIGDTIYAAFNGQVRVVKNDPNGYGNYVVIRHYNGFETIYGHMSKQLVGTNDFVQAGDPIGLGGNTGRSTGSHLHFEVRFCGIPIDPAEIFDFKEQTIKKFIYVFKKDC